MSMPMNALQPLRTAAVMFALFGATFAAYSAPGWFGSKQVGQLHAGDGRPCIFFTLEGVGEADVVTPGSPWFALQKSHLTFKENYAVLLVAKAAKLPIHVATSGVLVSECGHVGVSVVIAQ
jgi:hypothetical protein